MSGALDLGDLYSKLRIDFSELQKAEAHARKFSKDAIEGFGKTEKAGKQLTKVGKYATGASVALLGMGAASFSAARDFGDSFSDVQKSVSDLDDSNVTQFKNEILKIGQSSLIGAGGVAQLVAAGGKLGESSKGALEFAKASEQIAVAFDFGNTVEAAKQAGDVIGNLRSSFGISTKEVLEFADAFNYFGDTTASNAKNITSIMARQGATVANVTNLTKGELAALAASFDAVAPSSEVAATGMKNMILSLASGSAATKKQAAAMAELGFDAEELAERLTTDATGAIEDVLRALGNVAPAKKAGLAMQLFGRESIGAISPLIANLGALEDNFKRAGDSSKFLNSVKKEYDRLNSNDNAQFTKALNTINVALIKIGDVILPVLARGATAFAGFISSVNELDPGLVRIGLVVAGVAAAIGPLLLGLGAAVTALAPLVASAGGLGAAFTWLIALAGPVGLAIAAVAAGAVLIYKNWEKVKQFLSDTVNSIIQWFQNWASENADLIADVQEKWGAFAEAGKALWDSLISVIGSKLKEMVTFLDEALEPIGGLQGAWEILKESVGITLTFLLEGVGNLLSFLTEKFGQITEVLNGQRNIWNLLGEWVADAGRAISERLVEIVGYIKDGFQKATDYLMNLDWGAVGRHLMEGLKNGILAGVDSVKGAVKNVGDGITEFAKGTLGIRSPSTVFKEIGQFTMAGLAAGIVAGTPLATQAAEEAAKATIAAFDNAQAGNGGFGGGFNNAYGGGSGFAGDDNGIPGFPSISKISAYYDERIALLQQKGLQETEIFKAIEMQKTNTVAEAATMQLRSYSSAFDSILTATRGFAGEQSGIYKAMFAASKAFAIAESIIAIQQNIANAMKVGFPQNIPFIAGAIAQGANIISTIQSITAPSAGAFYNGGNVPSGMSGIAGEKGVEIVGPAGVMSTQKTKELLSGKGSGGEVNLYVEVINNAGATVRTEGSGASEEDKLKIYIDKAVDAVTSKISRGGNPLSRTMEQRYGLNRNGR